MQFKLEINVDNFGLSASDIALHLQNIADVMLELHNKHNSASPSEWPETGEYIFDCGARVGKWAFSKRRFRSEDGYTFYMQSNGTLTDTWDPERADWEYSNLDELKAAVDITEVL